MGSTAKTKQGIEEEERKTDEQAVNTGRLGKCTADQKRFGDGALALRLSCDGLDGLTCGITFADTGADTCDHGKTCADCGSSFDQSRAVNTVHNVTIPFVKREHTCVPVVKSPILPVDQAGMSSEGPVFEI